MVTYIYIFPFCKIYKLGCLSNILEESIANIQPLSPQSMVTKMIITFPLTCLILFRFLPDYKPQVSLFLDYLL